jgi:predicted lipid-binding transport protein (Tim44 family)
MDKNTNDTPRPNLLTRFAKQYSGPLAGVVLSALSAWMIVTGLKGLAGFEVSRQSALADLAGIAIVIGIARWIKLKYDVK